MTKAIHQTCTPRAAVLDGTADFVVNLADLPTLTKAEAADFLDSNVLTSGMELLLVQAFARLAGAGSSSGIYKLSESMGGGRGIFRGALKSDRGVIVYTQAGVAWMERSGIRGTVPQSSRVPQAPPGLPCCNLTPGRYGLRPRNSRRYQYLNGRNEPRNFS